MALSLVSYDDSDESETECEAEPDVNSRLHDKDTNSLVEPEIPVAKTNSPIHISDDETEDKNGFDKPINIELPKSKLSLLNTDIDVKSLTSSMKRNGPVKITIPSLNEVEEPEEQPSKKKLKPSQKGSGLFALLPSPKSSIVPQSVIRNNFIANKKTNVPTPPRSKPLPKATNSAPKVPPISLSSLPKYDDSGDEDESSGTIDFFSLDAKQDDIVPVPVDIEDEVPKTNESLQKDNPKIDDEALKFSSNFQPTKWPASSSSSSSSYTPQTSEYPTQEFMTFETSDLQLDQEAMQQLCGRKDRLKMQEVNIIDVSGDAIMPDSREWMTKHLTEETVHRPSHKKNDGPTSQQKRKHQITYLAFQAKENELELKNQWANNRMTRKQTQSKYGF